MQKSWLQLIRAVKGIGKASSAPRATLLPEVMDREDMEAAINAAILDDDADRLRKLNPSASFLNTNSNGFNALESATGPGSISCLRVLLTCGADPNFCDNSGWTPLFLACSHGRVEAVRVLLTAGANVHIRLVGEDGDGSTPMHYAARSNNPTIIDLIYQAGGDPKALDEFGQTPLDWAMEHDKTDAIKRLFELVGSNPQVRSPASLSEPSKEEDEDWENYSRNHDEWMKDRSVRKILSEHPNWILSHVFAAAGLIPALNARMIENRDPENENSVLHAAALYDQGAAIDALIALGADVNATAMLGGSPLHYAASQGALNAAKALIRGGADVSWQNTGLHAPIHEAACWGHPEIIELLVESGVDPNVRDGLGRPPLSRATAKAQIACIETLIRLGADPNATGEMGNTALIEAVMSQEFDLALHLVKLGADPELRNELGDSAADFAETLGRADLFKGLRAKPPKGGLPKGVTASLQELSRAVALERWDLAAAIIGAGVSPDELESDGETLLMGAAVLGEMETAEFLLKHGANPNVKSSHGETALHKTIAHDELDVAILLLRHGANANCVNGFDESPLCLAAQEGQEEIVRVLLQHGADVKWCDEETENTALHAAVAEGYTEVAAMLVANGANIHAMNTDGWRPLSEALRAEDEHMLEAVRGCQ